MMGRKSYTKVTSPKSIESANSTTPADTGGIVAQFLPVRKECFDGGGADMLH